MTDTLTDAELREACEEAGLPIHTRYGGEDVPWYTTLPGIFDIGGVRDGPVLRAYVASVLEARVRGMGRAWSYSVLLGIAVGDHNVVRAHVANPIQRIRAAMKVIRGQVG